MRMLLFIWLNIHSCVHVGGMCLGGTVCGEPAFGGAVWGADTTRPDEVCLSVKYLVRQRQRSLLGCTELFLWQHLHHLNLWAPKFPHYFFTSIQYHQHSLVCTRGWGAVCGELCGGLCGRAVFGELGRGAVSVDCVVEAVGGSCV